jgi:hypothetical protein
MVPSSRLCVYFILINRYANSYETQHEIMLSEDTWHQENQYGGDVNFYAATS